MGIFNFLKQSEKSVAQSEESKAIASENIAKRVSKLIAQLEIQPINPKPDDCYGYVGVAKIINELAEIGDPAAIPSLVAKQMKMTEHLDLMMIMGGFGVAKENIQFLSELRMKTKQVIDLLTERANVNAPKTTQLQPTSDQPTANEGRAIVFVIPCGVCECKTEVTVTIDWGGRILSGKNTNHEFRCMNCNKVFKVSNDSLKQYTDRFV